MPRSFGRDTYDEILSVGAVNAITGVAVRKRLANFYRGNEAPLAIVAQVVPYREVVREKMPYAAQAAIRRACAELSRVNAMGEPVLTLPSQCTIDLDAAETTRAISAIVDADFRDSLVRRLSDLDNNLVMVRHVIERTAALDDYLAGLQL